MGNIAAKIRSTTQPVTSSTQSGMEIVSAMRMTSDHLVYAMDDVVAIEQPIALVYNGISYAVMMATPRDIEQFALGFSLSEGIIENPQEIFDLEINEIAAGIEVQMTVSSRAFHALRNRQRAMAGPTGCGLCGVSSLEQAVGQLDRITNAFQANWLQQLPLALSQLHDHQHIASQTGGTHAAAWVTQQGIIVAYEDVGRHNALDKLLGHVMQHAIDRCTGYVLITSRASYELIRKCARLNIAMLASISAPSSLAVTAAKQSGMTLASFCRGTGYVLYTNQEGIYDKDI